MRALLFSNLFPTSGDPNRGLFTRQLAAELARLCDLEVVVPLPWFPSGRLAARLVGAVAHVVCLAGAAGGRWWRIAAGNAAGVRGEKFCDR